MMSLMALATAALLQSTGTLATAVVFGRVIEQGTGVPISEARVTLRFVRPEPERLPFQQQSFSATTDRDGRFEFEGLEAGAYYVSVERAGFAVTGASAQSIDVVAGERCQAERMTLAREAVIVGRVLAEDGSPLAGASVKALLEWTDHRAGNAKKLNPAVTPAALTDESGDFRLTALPAGDYYILAEPPRGSAQAQAWASLPTYFPQATDKADAQVLTVTPGPPAEPITIRIVGAPAYQVSGTVFDDRGQPIADAMLELEEAEASTPRRVNAMATRRSRTDISGHFTIEGVTDGDYILVVAAPVVIAIAPASDHYYENGGGGSAFSHGDRRSRSAVYTQTRGGFTTRYTFADATEVPLAVRQNSVSGVRVIVPAKQ